MNNVYRVLQKSLLMLGVVLSMTGCITMGAQYDEKTDTTVMSISQKGNEIFAILKSAKDSPEAEYKHHKESYRSLDLDFKNLELRTSIIDNNHKTEEQIVLLRRSISRIEKLHKTGFGVTDYGTEEAIKVAERMFKTAVKAILKFEFSKKRGLNFQS